MEVSPPHFTWSRVPCISLWQVALEVRRAPSHAATCIDCSAPSYSFPLNLLYALFAPTPKIKILEKIGTSGNNSETPKLQTLEKSCKAKATHLRWSSECSTTQNTKSKTVEHCFFLNYRWAALTTKETQEELVSGSNRKHLHNMHGAFSASRRCWMKSPTGWGSPLSVGV